MIKSISTIILLLLITGSASPDYKQQGIPVEVSMAFKAGNAEILTRYLNSTIELVMPDREDFYKKEIAEEILKKFFSNHKTTNFAIKHQGGGSDKRYAIGDLKTSEGDFRIYFLMKSIDGKPLIHQLRIEKNE